MRTIHLITVLILFGGAPPAISQTQGLESGPSARAATRASSLTTTRVNTREVGDRFFRERAGIPNHETTTSTPAPPPSAKGGMAKGGMPKSPIITTQPALWEVWGSLYYYTEDIDGQNIVPPPGTNFRAILIGETEFDLFGGTIGVERRFGPNWALGLALGASSGEVDSTVGGILLNSADVDAYAVMPYVSYQRENALWGGYYWADLMYAYNDLSYDLQRNNFGLLASASPDGHTHSLDFNTGLTFKGGSVHHGPYAGLRWVDGSVDAYTEFGPGGGAIFPSQDLESLVSTLGYSISVPIVVSGGVLVPQAKVAWEHEFEDNAGAVFGLPLGTVDEDFAVVGVGLGFYGRNGWNGVIEYEARIGSDVEGHYIGAKVGKEF
jgi:uncharacterized protein YhjY with autotransporter beta-barrel domain